MSLAFAPGTTFARYRIESLVGRGGMGVVYRASDLSLERTVALKLIAPEFAEDEGFRRRFLRESRLAASLEHPSVVPIHEAGERDGQLYLAMRHVEGSDLRTLLEREGPLGAERSLAVLGQIADALDAAHRRALVHRDVKPANVLIDGDGHAYLTDFGVSKQLGGDSTESGQLVGTLDYLAPEQIRGGRVDARADVYALACVLYQCLAGAAPFHRATEAETLWAHMQEDVPALAGQPALTPVLKRGLAKQADDRYSTCGELIDDARATLARSRVPRAVLRRRHAILAAGLLVLAATMAAAVVRMTNDDGPRASPAGNGIVAIGAADDRITSFTQTRTAPSNIAVGEGAVWVLDTQERTVSRIEPSTAAAKRFSAGPRPSDLAAGGGAVWVGNSGVGANYTTDVRRVDARSLKITATTRLSRKVHVLYGPPQANEGHPQIAAGAGAVWALSPDRRVYRIDPGTGRIAARIDVAPFTRTLAAGPEGVWLLDESDTTVQRIDPATNLAADQITINSDSLAGIAVGGGAVWVTSPEDGLLWRIEPGPRPLLARSIDVGVGVSFVSVGDGAVWTANYMDGTATRIDLRTKAVTAVPVGAAQAIAAGAGSAWVSVAGGTRDGTLPASSCGSVESGGAKPDVLIASDLPLQGAEAAETRGMADAIRFVLKDRGFRAGARVVGYQSCDDSTAQTGAAEQRRCAGNANAFARAEQVVAVIGPYDSSCAEVEIPILNRAPGGPLALVSPTNFVPSLTRGPPLVLPGIGTRGAPDVFYPTGTRNYARVIARADLQGVAHAVLARRLGLSRVYLLDARATESRATVTDPFRRAAARLDVGIAGSRDYAVDAPSYAALAGRVARSGADGVVIAGYARSGGGILLKALRARLGAGVPIMVGEEFGWVGDILDVAGRDAHGVYAATSYVLAGAGRLTPAAARFAAEFGGAARQVGALHAAQATEVVLAAIARSDGTRASVLRSLRSIRIEDGILGSFGFDRNGDITPATVTIVRITGATPPDVHLPASLQGAVVDRVLRVPASLSG